MSLRFHSNLTFRTRETKAGYIYDKYREILIGRIADVGADKQHLLAHLPPDCAYTAIGLEPDHDVRVDLEEKIPLPDDAFDCVLCLSVLEHVENLHQLFDELCRITRRWLILQVPNAWAHFLGMLRYGVYQPDRPMKFYNLPNGPPRDRHRWFFSATEAERFFRERGRQNGMTVTQIDTSGPRGPKRAAYAVLLRPFVHRSISLHDLLATEVWAVLCKEK